MGTDAFGDTQCEVSMNNKGDCNVRHLVSDIQVSRAILSDNL